MLMGGGASKLASKQASGGETPRLTVCLTISEGRRSFIEGSFKLRVGMRCLIDYRQGNGRVGGMACVFWKG